MFNIVKKFKHVKRWSATCLVINTIKHVAPWGAPCCKIQKKTQIQHVTHDDMTRLIY